MEIPVKIQNQLNRYCKQVEQFNADLAEYVKVTGSNDVPLIDSTVIGYDPLEPYEIKDRKNGFDVIADGIKMKVRATRVCGEIEVTGWTDFYDGVRESLAYDRRRLSKGWRVWKSENPDAELERDDEDDE